jgi:Tol biopolymer transport system component/C-terminal processing protease CtpA/Prc
LSISTHLKRRLLTAAAMLTLAGATHAAEITPLPSLAEPALSPDGREIAFASGGDIWTAPAQGGQARLLVTDPATESRPLYSPDGSRLAFVSTRSGAADIYVLTFATGELRRITWSDVNQSLDGWSRDGKWLYFTSGQNDVRGQGDIFRVSAEGGTPLEVSRERYLNEFESAPSPDGASIALVARGISSAQWWRNGHSHIDETELWLKPVAEAGGYRRLLPGGAKHSWPMWSPDGSALYYMSDESGAENIWRLPIGGEPQQVTRFTDGRVLWPQIGYDGASIVFERGFAIWRVDLQSGQAAQVPISLRGAPASAGNRHLNETSFTQLSLSPDGKKAAVIAHGEVFAVSAKDGGAAQRISRSPAAEGEVDWSPDSGAVVYVSERGLNTHLVRYDFERGVEELLTSNKGLDASPTHSPDGKMIAYVHGARELHVLTLASKGKPAKDVTIYTGPLGDDRPTLAWSPDSQWLAFTLVDRKSFRNVNVIPAAGGTARPVSFLANGQTGGRIAWSPDGKFILFDTAQRSEDARMVRVDLLPHVPKYREDAFRDLFKPGTTPDKPAEPNPPAPAREDASAGGDKSDLKEDKDAASGKAKKARPEPVKIVFEGIRERASILPLGMDAEAPVISPDGKTLVYLTDQGGQQNLYAYSLDELAKEPPSPVQLTTTRKAKSGYAFTADSKEVFYLDGGAIFSTPIESPKAKALAANAEMDVDFDTEKMVVFDEAWRALDRGFFDPAFNGKDWAGLRAKWLPYVAGARTGDELRRDINLMIGELNASHSGIGKSSDAPDAHKPVPVGNLGLRFERQPYEAGRGLVIREVVALGPAAIEGSIVPGETLVSVNGKPVGPGVDLYSLLTGEVGKKTVLGIGSAKDPARVREAVVRPVSGGAAGGLLYRQWVNDRRAYVEKISGGRLGYVHIPDMTGPSLQQLYIDLDAQNQEKQGVVIDLRNNNGGFINGYVLDVFSRRNFLTMTPRDLFAVPSRQALGQRALGSPTVLVTNESSLSDAEDFSEGYRALGVGKIVGQPTAGWIIYTSPQALIDGSSVRIPSVRIQDGRGQDMEMHPRPVDLAVERPLGETAAGRDAQLEAAAAELLKTLGGD